MLPEWLTSEAELQEWARANHQVQLQAIAQAAAAGFTTRAWQIFFGQSWSLGSQWYWADFLAVGQVVLAAAEAETNLRDVSGGRRDRRQRAGEACGWPVPALPARGGWCGRDGLQVAVILVAYSRRAGRGTRSGLC